MANGTVSTSDRERLAALIPEEMAILHIRMPATARPDDVPADQWTPDRIAQAVEDRGQSGQLACVLDEILAFTTLIGATSRPQP